MVTYNPTTWVNGNSGGTPINAARLNNIENFLNTIAPLIGTGGGNTQTAIEVAAGSYAVNGTVITQRQPGYSYVFYGLNQPPFQAAGDTWVKLDLGYALQLVLKSQDDFNDGANTSPATAQPLKTKWGGDTAYFNQSSTGLIQGSGWDSSATEYIITDSTALAARQAVEIVMSAFSSNTTKTPLRVFLNMPTPTNTKASVTGYRISATVPATGDRYWQLFKYVSGTGTQIGTNIVDNTITTGIAVRVEHDGSGTIKVTSGNSLVATFTDTASVLTGVYAGLAGNNPGGSGVASAQNVKADNWKAYA